jgi:hypothetical protein
VKKIFTFALTTLASGCSNIPMKEDQPIQYNEGFWQSGFYQDGHFVDDDDALSKKSKVPAAKEQIQTAKAWVGAVALDGATAGIALGL